MKKRPEVHVKDDSAVLNGRTISLPHIKILESIDSGAHGAVFKGIDIDLEREVAIKIWYKPGGQVREGAMREVRRLAAVAHPLFVTVYRLDIAKNTPYAMMELVPGRSIKHWLNDNYIENPNSDQIYNHLLDNQENIRQRCAFWFLYSSGLRHVYNQGALHGDPHTGNLLVVEDQTGVLKSFYKHHVLKVGSYSALKIIDLGTSFLWDVPDDRKRRESKLIMETANRLFPDFLPSQVMSIKIDLDPESLLRVLDKFAEYVLELSSIPLMTKMDFDFLSHGLPQLLGWCPFFNYHEVSAHLHAIFRAKDADMLIRDTRSQLESKYNDLLAVSEGFDATNNNLFPNDVEALIKQAEIIRQNNS